MGMVGRASGIAPKSNINITPYVDILLVLLIIFMVIQPTTQYDLRARVPEDAPDLPENVVIRSDAIVISISENGTIRINQDPVGLNRLGARLFELYSARANKNLFIQGDPEVPFGDVIGVIDIAKGAGVGDVGLMVENSPG